MKNDELKATVQGYLNDSHTLGELTSDMANALNYYYGQPYGNEVEGRSQVTTREVMETIETAMPEFMRVFASEEAVEFDPVGPDDEEAAKQETEVIRHIAFKQNEGIIEIYNWIKDGLLQRVGYAKAWREEEEETTEHTVEIPPEAREMFEATLPENAKIIEEDIESIEIGGEDIPVMHKLTIAVTEEHEQAKWQCVAPEEMRISKNASTIDLDEIPFVAQVTQLPASDLIEMGFDRKLVDELPAYGGDENWSRDQIEYSRATHSGEDDQDTAFVEKSLRPIEVSECYLRTDFNDDGIAELRRVLMAGGKILENEEVEQQPFVAWCPYPMPHQHVGLSLADMAIDIQLQTSTLFRQMLDNLYLTNSPEREVEIGLIPPEYMDLWLKSTPGGIKPTKKLGASREMAVPFTAGASVPMLELLEKQKEARTGQSMSAAGLDPNILARSTEGAFMGAMERSGARNEMIARLFAEQGMKKLFQKIHHIMASFEDKELQMRINGEYMPISPSRWTRRTDMTVLIGTGNATTMQRAATAKQVLDVQERLIQGGGMGVLVTADNIYNAATDFIAAIGKRKADRYFQDPAKAQPQEPKPDPQTMMLQMQYQLEQEKIKNEQAKIQTDQQKAQASVMKDSADAQLKQREIQLRQREQDLAEREQMFSESIEIAKLEQSASIENRKLEADLVQSQDKRDTEIEKARIQAEERLSASMIPKPEPAPAAAPQIVINEATQPTKKKVSVTRTGNGLEGEITQE